MSNISVHSISVVSVAKHRNGITGAPFHVVCFLLDKVPMVATVFEAAGYCAVLNVDTLPDTEFGKHSFRGDIFEPALRTIIAEYDAATLAAFEAKQAASQPKTSGSALDRFNRFNNNASNN